MTENYPWFAHYPEGVAKTIDPELFTSIPDLLSQSVVKFSDHVAFENMGKTLTYQQVDHYSTHFAAYLQEIAGLEKGDRIVIQMPNLLQYPIVLFGALKAGLVVVNTNPLYTPREMQHQFSDSGATAIVIVANFAHNLEEIIANTPIKTVIVTELGDMLGGFKKWLVNFVVKRIKKMVPAYQLPQAISLVDAINEGEKADFSQPEITLQDNAFLQYRRNHGGV